MDSDILTAVRTLAHEEGRQLQALVDEALPTWWKSAARPARVRTSWTRITPAMKNLAASTSSSLNDALTDARRSARYPDDWIERYLMMNSVFGNRDRFDFRDSMTSLILDRWRWLTKPNS